MKVSRRLALGGGSASCSPIGAEPNADGSRIYVACEHSGEVLEIDAASWSVIRRITVGGAPGAFALTRDGRLLVVADRTRQAVALIDLGSGTERARIATRMMSGPVALLLTLGSDSWPLIAGLARWPGSRLPINIALSPDDRYAFVTISRLGLLPGAVEVVDLAATKAVETVDVGPKAVGIGFWKMQ